MVIKEKKLDIPEISSSGKVEKYVSQYSLQSSIEETFNTQDVNPEKKDWFSSK